VLAKVCIAAKVRFVIETSASFRRVAHQASCKIDDEVAILDVNRALYFGLQGCGVQIWDALGQPQSLRSLCSMIEAAFDVPTSECERDVSEVLDQLLAEGLIEKVAES
jgi:hypothetical protein